MIRPINSGNAIESAALLLMFERPFTKQELQSLLRLEHEFREELPSFNKVNSINVKLIDGKPVEQSQDISGVLLQCFEKNGKPGWELKIETNIIQVSCFAYTTWNDVWSKSCRYFLETLAPMVDNRLLACYLKIVDKFVVDDGAFEIADIFSTKTPYLTQLVLTGESGRLWHVFQGWLRQEDDGDLLENLNILAAEESGKLAVSIDHMAQCQFFRQPQRISALTEAWLKDKFSLLHNKNKAILKNLLCSEQLKRIGL